MQSQTQAHALASESSLGITGAPGASAQVGRHLMVNGTLAGQKQSASSSLSAVSSVAPRSWPAKTSSSGVMKGVVEGWWNMRPGGSGLHLHSICLECVQPRQCPVSGKVPLGIASLIPLLNSRRPSPHSSQMPLHLTPAVAKLPPEPGHPEQQVFDPQRFRDVLAPAIDEAYTDEYC